MKQLVFPYSSVYDESCSLLCLHGWMETGFEGLLLSGFSGWFPGFAVKEEEMAAGRVS